VPCGVRPVIIFSPSPIAECHGRHSAANVLIFSMFSSIFLFLIYDVFHLNILYKILIIFALIFIIKSFHASVYYAGGLPVADQKQSNLFSYDSIILLFFSYNQIKNIKISKYQQRIICND
jgi:hypothetical protein